MKNADKRTVKIGLIQVQANYGPDVTVTDRLNELLHLAECCLKDGADLVLMPEAYQYSVPSARNSSAESLARTYAGGYKEACAELARKYAAYLVPWDNEVDENGMLYNTSYILDRNGIEIGRYRKVHLTHDEMKEPYARGSEFPVFELDFGKVGIMICYDNYYPESAALLALNGAELILYPLFGDTLKSQWEIKLKARAIDNTVFVASCHIHSAPREEKFTYTGIVSPTGDVLCRLHDEGTYAVCEIDLAQRYFTNTSAAPGKYEDIKHYVRKLRNPEAYRLLAEEHPGRDWEDIEFEEKS
ncbi:carbon-nitrogen hydrolase family protein [Cohnella hongkongensis]|uniref:Carbon-nitrogen hydrolase family protein n=1 Tax=Cohnella hongkongensis TaxID=178337 RepID=A0ABV9F5X3_9BACL